jgi:hypothetical protein
MSGVSGGLQALSPLNRGDEGDGRRSGTHTPNSNIHNQYYISRPSSPNRKPKEYAKRFRVAIVGSGNWGTTVAKIMAENTREHAALFDEEVRMWVFEEQINGRKLTEIINTEHENVR